MFEVVVAPLRISRTIRGNWDAYEGVQYRGNTPWPRARTLHENAVCPRGFLCPTRYALLHFITNNPNFQSPKIEQFRGSRDGALPNRHTVQVVGMRGAGRMQYTSWFQVAQTRLNPDAGTIQHAHYTKT